MIWWVFMNIEHLLPLVWNMWIVIFKSDLRLPPSVLRSSSSAHAQKFSWNNAESSSWPLWRASVRFWLRPSEVVTLGTVAPSYMAGIVDPNSQEVFVQIFVFAWIVLGSSQWFQRQCYYHLCLFLSVHLTTIVQ